MPWKRPARRSPVAAATLVLALAGSQVGCSRTTAPAATEGAPATSHPPGFAIEEGGAGRAAGPNPVRMEPLPVGEGDSWGVAISPDGKYLAAGYIVGEGDAGGVVLWDASTRRRLTGGPLAVPEGGVSEVAFGADGRTLAAGYGDKAGRGGVVLWDAATHRRLADGPLGVPEGTVTGMAFTPDGKMLAAGYGVEGGGGVVLWDLATHRRRADGPLAVPEGGVLGVAISPDGRTLAAGYGDKAGRGGVVLWDTATRRRRTDQPLAVDHGSVTAVAISTPDGTTLAAGYGGVKAAVAAAWQRCGTRPRSGVAPRHLWTWMRVLSRAWRSAPTARPSPPDTMTAWAATPASAAWCCGTSPRDGGEPTTFSP